MRLVELPATPYSGKVETVGPDEQQSPHWMAGHLFSRWREMMNIDGCCPACCFVFIVDKHKFQNSGVYPGVAPSVPSDPPFVHVFPGEWLLAYHP